MGNPNAAQIPAISNKAMGSGKRKYATQENKRKMQEHRSGFFIAAWTRSATARDPAVCACALGSAGSRRETKRRQRRVKSEPLLVPEGEPYLPRGMEILAW